MFRALVLFLVLPWWAYFGIAAGAIYYTDHSYKHALEMQAKRAAALEAGPPPVVDLAAYDEDLHKSDIREINVRGWIDTDLNYELVETKNGVAKTTRYMFMLFGEGDAQGSKVVRAAMVFDAEDRDRFVDNIDSFVVDFGANGLVFGFNGYASGYATLNDLAADAIEEKGLRKAEDFFYIAPFFDGREAALTRRAPSDTRSTGWTISGMIALIGVFKFLRRRKGKAAAKPTADSFADGPNAGVGAPMPAQSSAQASVPLVKTITPDSPLGRLAAKRAGRQTAPDPFAAPSPDAATFTGQNAAEMAAPDPFAAPTAPDPFARDGAPQPRRVAPGRLDPGEDLTHRGERPAKTEAAPKEGLTPAFLAKLMLAMLAVGALAYDPQKVLTLLPMILPILLLFTIYAVFFKAMRGVVGFFGRVARVIPTRDKADHGVI